MFVSPTNLHCSQTHQMSHWLFLWFVSPTNLHCSQTIKTGIRSKKKFVSPTNLHCSQTEAVKQMAKNGLFPLQIYTALKRLCAVVSRLHVCFPYKFTLLSNASPPPFLCPLVCFPYKFTLLSNLKSFKKNICEIFA